MAVMATAASFPIHRRSVDEEQRVVLYDVPWATYVVLRDSIQSPGVRMTYLEGTLEILRTSRSHEVGKTQIARLLELFCLERDIPLFGYGSTTFRDEALERGLEPDECYCRGADEKIPDIAIEVVVSHGSIDKLEVYRGLGVRELWVFEACTFTLFTLDGDRYRPIAASEVLPEVDLLRIAHFAELSDQHGALMAFRAELRGG
jgi:Uma2 family endonuclease